MNSLFEALPAEIILQIHLLSTSSTLHSVSRHVNACLTSSSTPSYRAQWLLRRLAREGFTPSSSLVPLSTSSFTSQQSELRRRRIPSRVVLRPCSSRSSTRIRDDTSGTSPEVTDALFLNKALKFPICNLETILLLEKVCLDNLNKRIQARYEQGKSEKEKERYMSRFRGEIGSIVTMENSRLEGKDDAPPPPPATFLPLPPKSIDIPKRLFRNLSSSSSLSNSPSPSSMSASREETATNTQTRFESEDLPLLLHILTNLQGNPNSNKGYALAKSVLSRHLFLIEILLEYNADPTIKDYMAVMLAIGRKDLEVVKMLVERGEDESSFCMRSSSSQIEQQQAIATSSSPQRVNTGNSQTSKKRKRGQEERITTPSSRLSPKRRRVEDRFQITSEMLELAVKLEYEPLIKFFMDKGAVPNLKTLLMLQG